MGLEVRSDRWAEGWTFVGPRMDKIRVLAKSVKLTGDQSPHGP